MARKRTPLAERFWPRVDKSGDCWVWTGTMTATGYGRIANERGEKPQSAWAHRVAYTLTKGPIPNGLVLDHLCRNTACVNPDHLEAVTQGENILRGHNPSVLRHHAGVCSQGHELTPDNMHMNGHKKSGREAYVCAICKRERQARYESRKRVSDSLDV
jgi:hypothetical protein